MAEKTIELREDGPFGYVIEVSHLRDGELYIEIDNEVNSLCMSVSASRVHDFAKQLLDMSSPTPKDS